MEGSVITSKHSISGDYQQIVLLEKVCRTPLKLLDVHRLSVENCGYTVRGSNVKRTLHSLFKINSSGTNSDFCQNLRMSPQFFLLNKYNKGY